MLMRVSKVRNRNWPLGTAIQTSLTTLVRTTTERDKMKLKVQYWRIKAKMTQENNSRENREPIYTGKSFNGLCFTGKQKNKQSIEGKVTSRAFFRGDIPVILPRVASNF